MNSLMMPPHIHVRQSSLLLIVLGPSAINRLMSGSKMLGFPNRCCKTIAKYIGVSAAIGSNIAWKIHALFSNGMVYLPVRFFFFFFFFAFCLSLSFFSVILIANLLLTLYRL